MGLHPRDQGGMSSTPGLSRPLYGASIDDAQGRFWLVQLIPVVGSMVLIVLVALPTRPAGRRVDAPIARQRAGVPQA